MQIASSLLLLGLLASPALLTPAFVAAQAPGEEQSSGGRMSAIEAVYNETRCGQGLLGGYFPVTDVSDTQLEPYAALALREYITDPSKNDLTGCRPDIPAARHSIEIIAACSQVVAGTNYVLVFNVTFPCRTGNMAPMEETLMATVFVPLPYQNAPPKVQSVTRIA